LYPVSYQADYLKERNRLTTFFRLIVAIPWLIVGIFYGLAAMVVVLIAWFALVILGRYPTGMYSFVGGVLRFSMRVTAFVSLQTDAWPSFGLSEDPAYPVRIRIAPPAARQSRLKALFRIILIIPLVFVSFLFSYLQQYIALIAWVTIVFRGYQPAAIHNALAFTNGWITRASSYMLLMRDEYPPVGDEVPVEVDPPAQIAAPPAPAITAPDPAAESESAASAQPEAAERPTPAEGEEPPSAGQDPPVPPTA
jgi:hypothetical protein